MIVGLMLATDLQYDIEANDLITQLQGLQFDPDPWIHHDPDQDKAADFKMNGQDIEYFRFRA